MSSEYDTQIFTLAYKARTNLIDMLQQQQYNVDDYIGFKTNELNAMMKHSQMDMLLENGKGNKIYVKYYEIGEKKPKILNKQVIDNMIEDLFTIEEILGNSDTLFIIANSDANDTIKNHIRHIWESQKIYIVIRDLKSLQFNILQHTYVPNHMILNEEEELEFRRKYNVQNDKCIPEISRFDPVAQIICIKPGQVCKIIRPSKNSVEAPYYRICKNK
jgi:DNA-directed RNA polymerase subunit H (RpoH/RPB5)